MTSFLKIHLKNGMVKLLNISNILSISEYANDKCVIHFITGIFEIETQEPYSKIAERLNIK
mgnify:CR=1 FL=1